MLSRTTASLRFRLPSGPNGIDRYLFTNLEYVSYGHVLITNRSIGYYLRKNNIPVNATNIYAAHFLGAGGAKTLLTAEPTAQADKILPQAASANKPIFYEKDGTPRTVQQVINVLFEKVGRSQERYKAALDSGIVDSGTTVAAISKENKDLKDATQTKQVASVINNTVISKSGESKMAETQEPVKDRPAYEIKARA